MIRGVDWFISLTLIYEHMYSSVIVVIILLYVPNKVGYWCSSLLWQCRELGRLDESLFLARPVLTCNMCIILIIFAACAFE